MSAHVLFNLLNELGKRDKIRGLPRRSSLIWVCTVCLCFFGMQIEFLC